MTTLDTTTLHFFLNHRHPTLTHILIPLTTIAAPTTIILCALALSLVLLHTQHFGANHKLTAFFPTIAVLIANLTSFTLKRIINRPRPPTPHHLVEETSPSLPSGHTVAAFALATAITIIWKKWWTTITWIIASIIALSRLYAGVHWLTDTLAGAILATTITTITWLILNHNVTQPPNNPKGHQNHRVA